MRRGHELPHIIVYQRSDYCSQGKKGKEHKRHWNGKASAYSRVYWVVVFFCLNVTQMATDSERRKASGKMTTLFVWVNIFASRISLRCDYTEKINRKDRIDIIICIMCNAVEIIIPLCQILNVNKHVICHEVIITWAEKTGLMWKKSKKIERYTNNKVIWTKL